MCIKLEYLKMHEGAATVGPDIQYD